MNPKSGGGKVTRFDLPPKAAALGAEVFLMSGPEQVDVAAVARPAVADGADLLGVAGGDGTQALVAEVAAEHGLPFVVITAGTRNHFALDLGLDRDDPAACLAALSDGVDLRVDLGMIGGRVFVNNASFGAYAEIVETPAYRGDKLGTTLDVLPSLLQGQRGARLTARADDAEITAPQALLVSNNQYGSADIAGLNRRVRLDGGVLGVVGVTVSTANEAVRLLRGSRSGGLTVLTAKEVTVTADTPRIPVGVDGEALSLPTPVVCSIRPGALRVRVPRDRPGATPPEPPVNFARLRRLALWPFGGGRGRVTGRLRARDESGRAVRPGRRAGAQDARLRHRAAGGAVEQRPAGPRSRRRRRFSARPSGSRRCGRWSSRPTPPAPGRPAAAPAACRPPAALRVEYLASAAKPLRIEAYRDFPRPGAVIGDQLPTDGILAYRLGYLFLHFDPPYDDVPLGPRLMHRWGQVVRPVLFRQQRQP